MFAHPLQSKQKRHIAKAYDVIFGAKCCTLIGE